MPGKTIKLNINDAHLHYFEYQIDELSTFISTWTPESGFNYEIKKVEHRVELFTARGEVDGGIYFAAIEAGLDPGAVIRLADIYAWDIDFNRELQAGDKFSILIEKIYIGEQFIRFGHILAATVEVDGIAHRAIYFTDKSGKEGYFDEQGHSLQRSFLRRPLPFGRVTCGFNPRRFHPVLKRRMPHYGVDFGAPIGTPVYAVGDGVITKTGYDKANGKYIKMRHNSVYSSAYCHLSRIKPGIKSGRRVKQGQTIGYVGKTGLATGPHLHLAFYRNGSYVNYLRVKFPSLGGIQKQDEERFAIVKDYSLRATEIN